MGEPADPDDTFAAIVAGFETEVTDPVPRWPVSEDADRHVVPPPIDVPVVQPVVVPYEEAHYVAPPAPPVPRLRGQKLAAVLAIAAGLLVLIGLPLVSVNVDEPWPRVAVVAVVGGLGTLVWQMRDAPHVDDGPDDGAVV